MSDCCPTTSEPDGGGVTECPKCGTSGREVQIVTPKSLLTPDALARIDPRDGYRFCPDAGCPVVYFGPGQCFTTADLMVRVFQKDAADSVPVCYCFAFTRRRIAGEIHQGADPLAEITAHVKAGRCACEFRNPQGSCCLGNVGRFIAER